MKVNMAEHQDTYEVQWQLIQLWTKLLWLRSKKTYVGCVHVFRTSHSWKNVECMIETTRRGNSTRGGCIVVDRVWTGVLARV